MSVSATMATVKAGVAAAMVGVGIHAAPPPAPAMAMHQLPVPYVSTPAHAKPIPSGRTAILQQIDRRLGYLVQIQKQELAGAESGGIYDTRHMRGVP